MPPSQPGVVRSYIPWCYANSGPVKKELDKRLGAHKYSLSARGGQFIVDGPRKLSQVNHDYNDLLSGNQMLIL
ncbi:hypothetical protein GQ607_003994 [Colletotrichum asianum]|uniref:Uncharacterized protein n=1 Tax=Colletotrichum asianum TaxID=702518 RepID=A0A8H3ZV11_9PEZI|nr:hypothetical protein GQ607_003994 [Colletotrichum asianum]